ncbi:hypothetical protein HAX54_008217 [Datura stramonium]|uniref:Uncharacterized protein n=1 Tax=Datura stramonium TaxID=4076 RepID=A0ABS8WXU0_DATST|nr:hypothetical protein [Datura stramonium]
MIPSRLMHSIRTRNSIKCIASEFFHDCLVWLVSRIVLGPKTCASPLDFITSSRDDHWASRYNNNWGDRLAIIMSTDPLVIKRRYLCGPPLGGDGLGEGTRAGAAQMAVALGSVAHRGGSLAGGALGGECRRLVIGRIMPLPYNLISMYSNGGP